MLARELFNIRSILQKEGIIFAYSGYLTEAVLGGVGEAVKHKLALEDTDTKTQRSVFAVFVEQVQNMIRYSAEKTSSEMRYGVLTIGRESDDYVVHAGNLVARSDAARLREKLDQIRNMDKEELRALHKERLRLGPEEGSKGASLGLMEIARRASKPIEFEFIEVDDGEHVFFALKASV
jgi:Family of unknown function (DUF6272)